MKKYCFFILIINICVLSLLNIFLIIKVSRNTMCKQINIKDNLLLHPQNSKMPNSKVLHAITMIKQIQSLSDPQKDENTAIYCRGMSFNYKLARPFLREIYVEGKDSLPALVSLFDDTNYLYSELYVNNSLSFYEKPIRLHTIGQSARDIFLNIVDPVIVSPSYKNYLDSFRSKIRSKTNPIVPFPGKMPLKEWWKENQNKTFDQQRQIILNYYIVHVEEVCKKLESKKEYKLILELTKKLLNDLKMMKVLQFQIDPELYSDVFDGNMVLFSEQDIKLIYGENLTESL